MDSALNVFFAISVILLALFVIISFVINIRLWRYHVYFNTLDIAIFFTLILTVISVVSIPDIDYRTTIFVLLYATGICLYFLIRSIPFGKKSKWWRLHIVYAIVVFNTVIAVCLLCRPLLQAAQISETLINSNILACCVASGIPIIIGLIVTKSHKSLLQYILLLFILIQIVALFLSRSRTVYFSVSFVMIIFLIAYIGKRKAIRFYKWYCSHLLLFIFTIIITLLIFIQSVGYFYQMKPLSLIGRTLIWRVTINVFCQNPITGIGYGNLANTYNFAQAHFFDYGFGTIAQKMSAGSVRQAFNWYLETAAEFGAFGLIIFGIFWFLILKNTRLIFFRIWREESKDYITLGMAASVMSFMLMSLTHFPLKIVPAFLIFNFALAWIASSNELLNKKIKNSNKNHYDGENCYKHFLFFSWTISLMTTLRKVGWRTLVILFSICLFTVLLWYMPKYYYWYRAGNEWNSAHNLVCADKYQEAENIYSNIYPKLKWNGRFLSYYGNILLQNKKYSQAIELFEKAKFTYPDPYLFENLGLAYMNYSALADFQQNGTNHPALRAPLLKQEGSFDIQNLTRDECINKAINYWILANNILPWRLTPKYYLADLFYQLGETNEAIKYARLVVNTPMKKWTEQGETI